MKREVELKFKIKDPRDVQQRLKKIGAKFLWRGAETNSYFDTPRLDLKKRGVALRLRQNKKGVRLTCKQLISRKKYKIARELELTVNDFSEMALILKTLGFVQILSYRRMREYWKFQGADITLDSLSIGKFVEIESSPQNISKLAPKLGLSFAKSTTKSYIELLESAKKSKV